MARCCLARTVTVVSLTVSLSAVGLPASSCHLLHPLLQPLREVAYSVYPAHWFHLYSVNMSSCYDSKEKSHHSKALTSPYPGSSVERSKVPSDKVGWLVEWKDYSPVEYTAASILVGPKWADPQISDKQFSLKFNEKDGQVERKSLSGLYKIENGRPRYSHLWMHISFTSDAVTFISNGDALCTSLEQKWKRDKSGSRIAHPVSGKNILQFVAIKRKDCGEWAIPGGMVDPGEKISATLKREFSEEALNSLQKSAAEIKELEQQLDKLFNQQHLVVYKGYVDDPRNTDNAWLETEAVNYHDESGETMDNMPLEAGDDAGKSRKTQLEFQVHPLFVLMLHLILIPIFVSKTILTPKLSH
ncbi:ADP-ribose pyrophosphatase, mitochondrial isoform C [Alligator mississippiensis]|uniref:ADP-ribose pyrophosphatase, mitochondrial n=1 Tax=Alligator mississippiensis TaxID=8496 RepID=A0A151NMK6_ALLMI|nr:ADP-ribose pyrophosphatase, mitochondrial isoform C [Alligator mississippiensis]